MVSRAEFAICSVFSVVCIALAGTMGLADWFAGWTGWTDPFMVNIGATGLAWIVAVGVASGLIMMIKRSKH